MLFIINWTFMVQVYEWKYIYFNFLILNYETYVYVCVCVWNGEENKERLNSDN